MAMGYALANSMLIEAPDGAIIVDVTETMKSGARAFAALREVSKNPVKAIIYTHNHADHVFGAKVRVAGSKTGQGCQSYILTKFPKSPMKLKKK